MLHFVSFCFLSAHDYGFVRLAIIWEKKRNIYKGGISVSKLKGFPPSSWGPWFCQSKRPFCDISLVTAGWQHQCAEVIVYINLCGIGWDHTVQHVHLKSCYCCVLLFMVVSRTKSKKKRRASQTFWTRIRQQLQHCFERRKHNSSHESVVDKSQENNHKNAQLSLNATWMNNFQLETVAMGLFLEIWCSVDVMSRRKFHHLAQRFSRRKWFPLCVASFNLSQ